MILRKGSEFYKNPPVELFIGVRLLIKREPPPPHLVLALVDTVSICSPRQKFTPKVNPSLSLCESQFCFSFKMDDTVTSKQHIKRWSMKDNESENFQGCFGTRNYSFPLIKPLLFYLLFYKTILPYLTPNKSTLSLWSIPPFDKNSDFEPAILVFCNIAHLPLSAFSQL